MAPDSLYVLAGQGVTAPPESLKPAGTLRQEASPSGE